LPQELDVVPSWQPLSPQHPSQFAKHSLSQAPLMHVRFVKQVPQLSPQPSSPHCLPWHEGVQLALQIFVVASQTCVLVQHADPHGWAQPASRTVAPLSGLGELETGVQHAASSGSSKPAFVSVRAIANPLKR
jgi:hypothetical protein